VDFILQEGEKLIAIEVKSMRETLKSSGVAFFMKHFSPQRVLLVRPQGIEIEEFLTTPVTHWFK
jgi:hypothetical protein